MILKQQRTALGASSTSVIRRRVPPWENYGLQPLVMKTTILVLLGCLSLLAAVSERPALVIVLVIDGLRPDSITPAVMPNLDRLKTAGVWYTHSHSVFPTVTRVNATSISTGMLPSRHGIASNSVYLPAISKGVLSNGDYRNLLSLGEANGGRVVEPKSLHEYLQARLDQLCGSQFGVHRQRAAPQSHRALRERAAH